MDHKIKAIILFTFLLTPAFSLGADLEPVSQELHKKNVSCIKIISSAYDRIHLFVTGHDKQTYRIAGVNEEQAKIILDRFKKDGSPLLMKTQPVSEKGFLDVVSWQ